MPAERTVDLHFPKAGLDLSVPSHKWPVRTLPSGERLYSCSRATNVRGYEPLTGRRRGGCRPGLSRYTRPQIADWAVQGLSSLIGSGYDPPGGGSVQATNSGRIVTVVAVVKGNIRVANPGDSVWTTPTNSASQTPPLNASGVVFSAPNQQKLYFADGLDERVLYNPFTNTISDWTTSAGTMPEDADQNGPRLICTWRGRCVQSGLLGDPQNIFMSAVDDPTDYNYSPANPSATDAVALNLSDLGTIGDVITGLVPCTDDVLVVLGDHTLWRIRGDPLAGGVVDNITDSIGAAWGQAWCKGPDGTVYFFSNVPGVYALPPQGSGQPVRISRAIDPLLEDVDTGNTTVSMAWDDRFGGVHVFITWNTASENAANGARHYFWEAPRPDGSGNAWWPDEFADSDMNPLCCCTVDGNEANDRVTIIGSYDGYVRKFDPEAEDDDGTPIASEVALGPLLTPNMDEVRLSSIQGLMAKDSADVTFDVLVGDTAEEAIASDPIAAVSGTFSAGRNYTEMINRAGYAIYLLLSSTGKWAMEGIRASLGSTLSAVRRRRK